MPRKKKAAPDPLPPLAEYLTKELHDRNLTLLEIADVTGIPDSTLSPIFSGQVAEPKATQLSKIARAMGIPWHKVMARATGDDDAPVDTDAEMQRIAIIIADTPELSGIMGKLTTLGPRDLRAVRKYIELLKSDD
jgi:transcriptional regulator with XRE-family HTH domain